MEIEAFTDHHILANLLTQKDLSGRQVRWVDQLAEFKITLTYKPRTQNIVADALSRRADHNINAVNLEEHELTKRFREETKKDPFFGKIWRVKDPNRFDKKAHADRHFPEYSWKEGVLLKGDRVCVPESLKQTVMQEAHNTPYGGHRGGRRMYLSIRENFFWPNMKKQIESYTRSC